MADVLFLFGLGCYFIGVLSGVLVTLIQLRKQVFLENKKIIEKVATMKLDELVVEDE